MALFRREGGETPPAPAGAREPAPSRPEGRPRATLIAAGTRVTGQVTGATEVHVEGEVEGEIRVDDTVVVGGQGLVKGQIHARTVRVGGRVTGDVTGADRVEVTASGSAEGDISAPRVVIAEGAYFRGSVEMSGGKRGAPASEQTAGASGAAPPAGEAK
jgi:cytoskeletal protein CcmA (bactofilin family)